LSRSPYIHAALASVAVAAAVMLAGCDADGIAPAGRAQAPLSDKTLAELEAKQMDKGSPVLMRIFKEEAEAEIWKEDRTGKFALLKTYPICRWSGDLGPKVKEGDRQAPEGFYTITPGQMNPNSNYYLAFNTGYPNAYDRSLGHTGSELMVHGDCSSRGCYAMTDEQMVEIYALARESFFGGQRQFQLQAYPFRMTPVNMAKHRNNSNMAFWKMLKVGYDHFEVTHLQPKVDVCEKRYVFDAATPENATHPISFSASAKCPVYEIPKDIADAVNDRRRQDAQETTQLIASGTPVVPSRAGIDGGMNPVFLAQLSQPSLDNNGRTDIGARIAVTPGALPRGVNNPPAQTVLPAQVEVAQASDEQPIVVANVPVPRAAPQAKVGEAPPERGTTIARMFGGLFSNGSQQAETPAAVQAPVATAPTRTVVARAKPARAAVIRTASAHSSRVASNAPAPQLRPRLEDEPGKGKVEDKTHENKDQAPSRVATATPPARELRSAYTGQTTSGSGLLAGAQPLVPTGTFENRWSAAGLR
jgi:murein L,D-transpeptidase YafK